MNYTYTILTAIVSVMITLQFGCTDSTIQTTDDGTEESRTELALMEN